MELNPELVPALGGGCRLPPAGRPLPAVMQKQYTLGFPGGAVVENLPANAGDTGSSPGLG